LPAKLQNFIALAAACLLFWLVGDSALAANTDRRIEREVTEKLNQELSSRLASEKFYVDVAAEVDATESKNIIKNIPIVPDYLGYPKQSGLDNLLSQVTTLSVTLYVDKSIGAEQRKILKIIVSQSLRSAGERLAFQIKTTSFPQPAADLANVQAKETLAKKISDLEEKEKTLERERSEIKQELTLTKSQLAEANEKSRNANLNAESKTPTKTGNSLEDLLFGSSVWIALVVLGLLTIVGLVFVLRAGVIKASGQVAQPFHLIAQALGELGRGRDETIDVTPNRESLPGSSALGLPGAGAVSPARLEKVHTDLVSSLDTVDEQYTLHYLNQLLSDEQKAASGVYVMEMMPREQARHLFDQLGARQKQRVSKFLTLAEHPRNKAELMLAAAEEFTTKLMKGHLGAIEEHLDQGLITKIELLDSDLLAAIARKLPAEPCMRLLLYLKPETVGELLSTLEYVDPKVHDRLSLELGTLAEFETKSDLDVQIEASIEQALASEARDMEKRYLPFFREVLSSLSDEHTEKVMKMMGEKKQSITEKLSQSVITVATFFKLSRDHQEECLEGFSNRDLAALAAICNPEQKELIQNLLGERRQDLFSDEVERLNLKGKGEIKILAAKARKALVAKVNAMIKTHGSLASLISHSEPSAQVQSPGEQIDEFADGEAA